MRYSLRSVKGANQGSTGWAALSHRPALPGSVLKPNATPPATECTTQKGDEFAQYQLILNASSGQMRSGLPRNAPGRHTAYGFGEYVCASADYRGVVGLAPCVEPVPSHQRWSFDPASQQLRVGGLAPAPPGQPADPRSDPRTHVASGLCLTRESHTISYLLDTVVTPAKGGGMAARSTSYNLTTGSRYCKRQ